MKRSTTGVPAPSAAGVSASASASAAKIKKRPSSLAELRDRQRSTKLAKTCSASASGEKQQQQQQQQQPSIASFFSPAAAPGTSSLSKTTAHVAAPRQTSTNPFRPATAKPPAPPAIWAPAPAPVPEQPDSADLVESATHPYHPRRTRRDPLSLLRCISTDAGSALLDSDSDAGFDDDDNGGALPESPSPPVPPLDVAALVKSVASLNVCVQGTQLALGARESAYRSHAYDDDDDFGHEGRGRDDDDDEGDAWGDAAMSSGDEYDDDDQDEDGRPAWFDALLDDFPVAQPNQSDMYPDPMPALDKPALEHQSTLDLLLASPTPSSLSTHALALPRRLTFTATHASTSTSLLSTFSPAVHPISDPSLLSTSFSAFFTSSPARADRAASLLANLHHFRFPPTPLAPAARTLLARTLAASTSWPPTPASADVAWYLGQVDMWQAAIRHLAADAPADGFLVVQQLAAAAASGGAVASGGVGGGFVVAVLGYLEGAYVLNASRGMRRAMVAAGVEGIKGVAGPGLVALRDEGAGQEKKGGAGRRKLARQYVVDYDGNEDDQGDHDDDVDLDADNPDSSNESTPAPARAAAASSTLDDPALDPTQTALLYIPPHSTPMLLSFLHAFPTTYNLQSAHAPDPELPVLLASHPFAHASVASAKVSKCGYVSSAVHGERAVRVQVDGWVLPWKVSEVVGAVVGGERRGEGEARVEVGVSWEDGCGVVREAGGRVGGGGGGVR